MSGGSLIHLKISPSSKITIKLESILTKENKNLLILKFEGCKLKLCLEVNLQFKHFFKGYREYMGNLYIVLVILLWTEKMP